MQFRLSHNQVEHNFGCFRVNWNAIFAGGVKWNACNLRCCAGRLHAHLLLESMLYIHENHDF